MDDKIGSWWRVGKDNARRFHLIDSRIKDRLVTSCGRYLDSTREDHFTALEDVADGERCGICLRTAEKNKPPEPEDEFDFIEDPVEPIEDHQAAYMAQLEQEASRGDHPAFSVALPADLGAGDESEEQVEDPLGADRPLGVYLSALAAPKRYQFEASSGSTYYSQVYNCGVTGATFIAQFMRDQWYGIEATRTNAGVARGRSTYYSEQETMLDRRGVPCSRVQITSLAQLRSIVRGGRRPVMLGVLMGRVPAVVRDHPFLGWHSIIVLDAPNGGFWVLDPNFSPPGGHRADPDNGRKWYSDAVMQYAFINGTRHTAIVPNAAKYIPAPAPAPAPSPIRGKIQINDATQYVNLRSGPGLNYPIIGSGRGPKGVAGAGIYIGSPQRYTFPLNSKFNYHGSDAANVWRKMSDYLGRIYWVQRVYTHLVT